MPEEVKPTEPPPSSVPTINGSRKHKTGEFANLELILEGNIRSIDKVKQVFESREGKKEFRGFETTITFHDDKENVDKKLAYPLLISSDSLYSGKIKIYRLPDGGYKIYDESLKRIYE